MSGRTDPHDISVATPVWSGDGLPSNMAILRTIRATLLSKTVPSPGQYSIWTGLAMLYVVWLIAPMSDTDRAVPFVALALAITGLWSIERGFRLERQRRRRD